MPSDERAADVAHDHIEITQLLFRYAHAFDAGDFDTFAELFADGTLHLEGVSPRATGTDEVMAIIDRRVLDDGSPRTNHLIHNPLIEVAPDRTSARASTATCKSFNSSRTGRSPRSPPAYTATNFAAPRMGGAFTIGTPSEASPEIYVTTSVVPNSVRSTPT